MTTRRKWLITGAGIILGLVFAVLWTRKPTTALTPEALIEAEKRWNAAKILDYDLRYRMHGSFYAVSVKQGIVTAVKTNDRDADSADRSSYSVPGLFRVLHQELEAADQFNLTAKDLTWKLRVQFHSRLGYPERYLRADSSMGRAASIEVIEFHARDSTGH